jgi:hypothetical protein
VATSAPPRTRNEPAAIAGEEPTVLVGGANGVFLRSFDGKTTKKLSITPARHPRWLPGKGTVLFLAPESGELRRIDIAPGGQSIVARIPIEKACSKSAFVSTNAVEYVQDPLDFLVSSEGERACLRLMDRNANMASSAVLVAIELRSSKSQSAPLFDLACKSKNTKDAEGAVGCKATLLPSRFSGRVGPKASALPAQEFMVESASKSGRYALVSVHLEEGDYIYRKLLIFDEERGSFFPIRKGPWGEGWTKSTLPSADKLGDLTTTATGETATFWLEDGEHLVVGSLVVTPGKETIDVEGDVGF